MTLGGSRGDTEQVLATLSSRNFISSFIADNKLMRLIFADKWDETSKMWKAKTPADIPTPLDASDVFQKSILKVTSDKKTGLVTLAIEWKDPRQAAAWANELVSRINYHEKQAAIKEAEQSIAYLKAQLSKTSVVEMQQVIYQLMEMQTKKIMLANVRDQYAFKVIDPAVAPEKRLKPKRKLIVMVGASLGLLISIMSAFILSAIRKLNAEGAKRNEVGVTNDRKR